MSIAKKSLVGALCLSALVIVLTASTIAALSFFEADRVIRDQTEQRLVSLRELQKEELSLYLGAVRKQLLNLAESASMRMAVADFQAAYQAFPSSELAPANQDAKPATVQASVEQARLKLQDYYLGEFAPRYRKRNAGERIRTGRLLDGLSDKAILLQYHYIHQNPNTFGRKDELVALNPDDIYAEAPGSSYDLAHRKYHPDLRRFTKTFDFYDLFIIDAASGNVLYSVFKELDFATSLDQGPYRNSALAKVFNKVRKASGSDQLAFAPFEAYTPSFNDPAAFIAAPVLNSQGETEAVIAFQLPLDAFNEVMTHSQRWQEKGMGATGETYLVGEDFKAKSISRQLLEDPDTFVAGLSKTGIEAELLELIAAKGTNIGLQSIETPATQAALSGRSGYTRYQNAQGQALLSAYSYLDFEGSRLALLVEMAEHELFAFQGNMLKTLALAVVGVFVLVFLLVAFLVWRYTRGVSKQLVKAVAAADGISRGERADIEVPARQDEIAELMAALVRMQDELLADIKHREQQATRIKRALDVCDTNVMVADPECNIIYMNDSMQTTMFEAQADLRTELSHFNAAELLGQNIDIFHRQASHQRNLLAALRDTYRTQIKVGGHDFSLVATPIFSEQQERLGTVVEWEDLTEQLREAEQQAKVAADNARIRTALDSVSASVMLADAERKIIYVNDAVVATLQAAERDIQQQLPQFSASNLLGQSIDLFHREPQVQATMLEHLDKTHHGSILVGGRTMALTANPVLSDTGERIGTVVEWSDRTAEVAIQEEIDQLVAQANAGNLSGRISLEGKTGAFLSLSEGLNELLDGVSAFVGDMGHMFASMSEGDLSDTITTSFQGQFEAIKDNANNAVAKLSLVMQQIQGASSSVRHSANEVAQGSDDLRQRTESQASSLEQTASSMEQITATVKQTSDNAGQANTLAAQARSKAEQGGEVVQEAVHAMSAILESSKKINDIIAVIDEIAFQTNLLALNAAVEAARAGEQGKGFAVVAGEVRSLSQRSAAAAKEIKDLIRDSVSKVNSGSVLVNQSGETLAEIVLAVGQVAEMIRDVNNAALEQNSGIAQINQAISQMDAMTQQNAALVEQTSAASRSMSEEAASMAQRISFFRLAAQASNTAGSRPSVVPSTPASTPVPSPASNSRTRARTAMSNLDSFDAHQGASFNDNVVSSYIDDIYR